MKFNRIQTILLAALLILNIYTVTRLSRSESSVYAMLVQMEQIIEGQKKLALNAYINSNSTSVSNSEPGSQNDRLTSLGREVFSSELKKTVRAVLRECNKDSDTFAYDDTQKSISPEVLKKRKINFDRGVEVIENAISAGKWTHGDNQQILDVIPGLSQEQQMKLRQKLAVAINTKKIVAVDELLF